MRVIRVEGMNGSSSAHLIHFHRSHGLRSFLHPSWGNEDEVRDELGVLWSPSHPHPQREDRGR